MSNIPTDYLDILQSTALAHVATIGAGGEPRVSPVWFSWDGTHLLFSMSKEKQRYRNILREPRVAVSIVDPRNPYRSLEIRGRVKEVREDLDGTFANSLSRKYLKRERNADEIRPGEERVIIVIEPERVTAFPPVQETKE